MAVSHVFFFVGGDL